MSHPEPAPRISVVLPTYQGEDRITDCLDSLARQTLPWERFEVLVVENGPPTGTAGVVAAWLAEHPGFALRHLVCETPGVSHARNLGLDEARGEYVTFVDDDDRVGPHLLEALSGVAAPDALGAVLAGFVTDGDFSKADFGNYVSNALRPFRGREGSRVELLDMLAATWGKIVLTSIAREIRFDVTLSKGEDTVFWVSLAARHRLRHVVADAGVEAAYLYNKRSGSLSLYGSGATWESHVAPRLAMAAALAAVPVEDPEMAEVRDAHYRAVFRVDIRSYLRTHPEGRERLLRAARDLGLPWIPWDRLNRELAGEFAILGALDDQAPLLAERLLRRGTVVDALTYSVAGSPSVLAGAEEVIDHHGDIPGPAQITWDVVERMAPALFRMADKLELGRGAAYRSILSCSASPLEHLLAAVLRHQRPDWSWTADVTGDLTRGANAEVPMGEGPVADRLRALLEARGTATARLRTLGSWAVAAVEALADHRVAGETVAGETVAGESVVTEPVTDGTIADQTVADQAVAARPEEAAETAATPSARPWVSVIVPTYQGEDWIAGCLDALAAQTLAWTEFEVVVVANGPRTATPEIVSAWLAAHPGFRLRLVVTEEAGVSHARNLGLDVAQGEYAAFVDDDDLAAPRLLEALLAAARPGVIPVAAVGFLGDEVGQADFENWYTQALLPHLWSPASDVALYPALTSPWAKLVPLDLGRRIRFREDLSLGEDRVFWLDLLAAEDLRPEFAAWSADAAYLYRIRGDSAMQRGGARSWEGYAIRWLDVASAMLPTGPERSATTRLREVALGYVFGTFLRAYLREHPEDIRRFNDELTARRLKTDLVPWRSVCAGLADELVLLGTAPARDAAGTGLGERLAESGAFADVVAGEAAGGAEVVEELIASAAPSVDQSMRLTLPAALTWAGIGALAGPVAAQLEGRARGAATPYRTIRSLSAAPVEHLLAALAKLSRPELGWTAELVRGPAQEPALGAGVAVEADEWFEILGGGLVEAGYPVEEVPEQVEAFSELVSLGLADRIVFDDLDHAESVLGRCPVPEVVARARSVMTVRSEREDAAA